MVEERSRVPVEGRAELIEDLEAGCKPREEWRIGTEHEKFALRADDYVPLAYEGNPGVRELLTAMQRFGWEPVSEDGNVIALNHEAGGTITLEPGGQVELSGAKLRTIHQTCDEVEEHLRQAREVGRELGIVMIGIGFQPKAAREDIGWMPKPRYDIMRRYMPTRGDLGLDMMLRTCTVQVNLDFADEADMARKVRIGMALQPVATAMFANSPFLEGRPTGHLSYRSHCWTDTDPDRCGILGFVFENGFGFERYVDWILDVPMYFVIRDGKYVDAAGQSFRDFLEGRLPALPGERPTMGDWSDHLTTVFPEVRVKRYIEMRGADGGPWRRLCALPALWVGLLYDDVAMDAAWELVRDWTYEEVRALRDDVTVNGLDARFRGKPIQEIAQHVVCISREGLKARGERNFWDEDETLHLATLEQIVDTGVTPAEHKLAAFRGRWGGDVDRAFMEYAY